MKNVQNSCNQNKELIVALLCGGSGTRLWPLSDDEMPKQFIKPIDGKKTLIEQTLDRLYEFNKNKFRITKILFVTNKKHLNKLIQVTNLYKQIKSEYILEEEGKNTAPALTLAVLRALEINKNSLILSLPVDHFFQDQLSFENKLNQLINVGFSKGACLMGAKPKYPSSNYGYIKFIKEKNTTLRVQEFIEKPSIKKSEIFINSGTYFWNTGIIAIKCEYWINLIKQFENRLYHNCKKAWESKKTILDNNKILHTFNTEIFHKIKSISLDKGVLENMKKNNCHLFVIEYKKIWSDIGTWDSIWNCSKKNKEGNYSQSKTEFINSFDNYVNCNSKMIGLLGIKDTIIVESKNVIMIANKDNLSDIKNLSNLIKKSSKKNIGEKYTRPWGSYEILFEHPGLFKIKKIIVNPGHAISLQYHKYRNEFWIVLSGEANVILGKSEKILKKNETITIKKGQIHRLINNNKNILEIIEIQTGSYLGEDDIVRLDDIYNRSSVDSGSLKLNLQ